MSNKRKIKYRAGVTVRPVSNPGVDRDIAEIFAGVGSEPLMDALVVELVGRGWSEVELRRAQRQGSRYNRRRDSLFSNDPDQGGSFGF